MSRFFFFTIFASFFLQTTTTLAQTRYESDDPLNKLLHTPFMEKFMDMRVAAESSVRSFKTQQEMYSPRDISRVQVAYDRTAEKFNFVLRGIKEDLMDKKKLKYIERYPDDYAKELELDMYKLSDFYANNYQQVLADVTNSQVDGSAVLALIAGVLDVSFNIYGLVKNISTFVSKNKARKQYFSEQRLEKVLIKPHLWTLWHEMEQQGDMYPSPDNTAQNISTLYQDQEAQFNSQYSSSLGQMRTKDQIAADNARARKDALIANAQADSIKAGVFKVQNDNQGFDNGFDNGFNNGFGGEFENNDSEQGNGFQEGYDENGNLIGGSEEGYDENGNLIQPNETANGTNTGNGKIAPTNSATGLKKKESTINIAIPTKSKKKN
ncbi:MAG: hypothetical protein AAF960_04515 [Bacteroidota bacterium]